MALPTPELLRNPEFVRWFIAGLDRALANPPPEKPTLLQRIVKLGLPPRSTAREHPPRVWLHPEISRAPSADPGA